MARGGGSFLLIRAISNQRKFSARASLDLREAFPRWLLRQHVTPISPRLFWGPISATPNSEFFCSRARRHLLVPYWRSIKECRQDDVHICPSHCCSWAVQACDVHEGASRSKWALNSYRPSRMRPTYFSSPHDRSLLILTRGDFFPFTFVEDEDCLHLLGPIFLIESTTEAIAILTVTAASPLPPVSLSPAIIRVSSANDTPARGSDGAPYCMWCPIEYLKSTSRLKHLSRHALLYRRTVLVSIFKLSRMLVPEVGLHNGGKVCEYVVINKRLSALCLKKEC